jgi:hypothetical protein
MFLVFGFVNSDFGLLGISRGSASHCWMSTDQYSAPCSQKYLKQMWGVKKIFKGHFFQMG